MSKDQAMRNMLARLSTRIVDYVGRGPVDPALECDGHVQGLAFQAEAMLGGAEAARAIAEAADPDNIDGRTRRRKTRGKK